MALADIHPDEGNGSTDVTSAETDRRTHLRLSADDLLWLQGVRIKYGSDVRVIDISAGGILFETDTELQPGVIVVFEVSGPDSTMLAPAKVLRRQRMIRAGLTRYQTACAFKRPLSIPDLLTGTSSEVASPAAPSAVPAIGQKVVARFLDGRIVRGYTNDFHASKPHLHLTEDSATVPLFVQVVQLKALFFVREFAGDADRVERKDFQGATYGRKVAVTFGDGEILVGTTLGFKGPEHPFFVQPADTDSNNVRVFVVPSATQLVRFF